MHDLLVDGEGNRTIVLAHGAGAPMDSDFMNAVARGLADADLRVVRFEFPYMTARREDGKKRPPNAQSILLDTWRGVLEHVASERPQDSIVIGGKSMGGRIASMIADEAAVAGLVCLGYPFHPPGKPDKLRIEHLRELATPTLIVQGERDPFGHREEVQGYALSPSIRWEWVPDGDHSWSPRKRSGRTLEQNIDDSVAAIATFVAGL